MKKHLIRFLKNKYALTAVVFTVWMLFLNDIDLIFVMKTRAELNDLKDQVEHLEDEIARAEEALYDLSNNRESLEKFAREEYLMRRPNEDLFIVREATLE